MVVLVLVLGFAFDASELELELDMGWKVFLPLIHKLPALPRYQLFRPIPSIPHPLLRTRTNSTTLSFQPPNPLHQRRTLPPNTRRYVASRLFEGVDLGEVGRFVGVRAGGERLRGQED